LTKVGLSASPLGLKRRASWLFGVQSAGGKETRQKCGQRAENSTPTSGIPAFPGFTSATEQPISSPVTMFFIRRVWPIRTRSRSCSSAPCAFTISVEVRSENALLFACTPEITTETVSSMRWLRLWFAYGLLRHVSPAVSQARRYPEMNSNRRTYQGAKRTCVSKRYNVFLAE
jgi:hypothetical protein